MGTKIEESIVQRVEKTILQKKKKWFGLCRKCNLLKCKISTASSSKVMKLFHKTHPSYLTAT